MRLALRFALLAVALLPAPAAAQEVIFPPFPQWTSPPSVTQSIHLVDVNTDGHLDLVQVEDSLITFFLGGGGTFTSTGKTLDPTESATSPAFGDIDGDGDVDLVAVSPSGVLVYDNDDASFVLRDRTGFEAYLVALFDSDRDGDLDLLRVHGAGFALHLNQGGIVSTGTFDPAPVWTHSASGVYGIAVADFTSDGYPDFVSRNDRALSPDGLSFFVHAGSGFTLDPLAVGPFFFADACFGDVDGDRDLDLVVPGALYRNDTGVGFSGAYETLPYDDVSGVGLADLDADGDLDLVMCRSLGGSLLLLNDGDSFGPPVSWGTMEPTSRIALGDVDGDGAPDAVHANFPRANTLYLNGSGWLDSEPWWTAASASETVALEVVDLDGDDDVDVIRSLPDSILVYANDEGTIATKPTDLVTMAGGVNEIAFGDADGDGLPELAVARTDRVAQVFSNVAGVFDPAPAWTGRAGTLPDVEFVDLDNDGDSDLVVGGDSSWAYKNAGGQIAADPLWNSAIPIRALATADVDGNGYPDLVTGAGSALFGSRWIPNGAGGLADASIPISSVGSVSAVALGDVNGDEEVDLVEATSAGPVAVYRGTSQSFDPTPLWTDPRYPNTNDAELADFDGDGDLDIGLAGIPASGGGVDLHRNVDGIVQRFPSWTNPGASSGELAVGDLDGDGDGDVVVTEWIGAAPGEFVNAYVNRNGWRTDPDSARVRHGLPDNPAHLRWVRVDPAGTNRLRISALAVDVESDPVWISGEYQFRGSSRWARMHFGSGAPLVGPLPASPEGIRHELEWNVESLPFDARDIVIRLAAISPPRHGAPLQYQPKYLKEIGRVTPLRPALGFFPFSLDFGTVTVGDTASATVQLTNVGSSDLIFDRLASADPAMIFPDLSGVRLSPGTRVPVKIEYAPRTPGLPGTIDVFSNDPLQPITRVPTIANVLSLQFQTQLISTTPELPLGEAVTVIVTPHPGVHLEGGFVSYRPGEQDSLQGRVDLVPQGVNLVAVIPGFDVKESGLEYYVAVFNDDLTATDPPGAPPAFHFQPVAAPTNFTAVAIDDADRGFAADEPIRIEARLQTGTEFVSGKLYYRAGGAALPDSLPFERPEISIGSLDPFAIIPAEAVGPRGIEYWGQVETVSRTLYYPSGIPGAGVHVIEVEVDNLAEASDAPAGRYRIVAVPLDTDLPNDGTLEGLLSDQPAFGPYDPLRWRSFRWRAADSTYIEIGDTTAAEGELRPEPGRAFWLISRDAGRIETSPVSGTSTLTASLVSIELQPGWNQFGNPFVFPVSWHGVQRPESIGDPVRFDPTLGAAGDYSTAPVAVLMPFEGYFIENTSDQPEWFHIPPIETTLVAVVPLESSRPASPAPSAAAGSADPADWSAPLVARTEAAEDGASRFGVREGAAPGLDAFDRRKPPAPPGVWVQVAFANHEWDERAGLYREDVRPKNEGNAWELEVRSARAGETVTLAVPEAASLPSGLRLRLLDRVLGSSHDVAPGDAGVRIVSKGAGTAYRLTLLAGSDDYVERAGSERLARPTALALEPPAPNPMRAQALLRFALPSESAVSLEIFDVAGQRVAAPLENERLPAGVHVRWWDGRGRAGARLPSGIYFTRLSAAGSALTRRLVLVR